MRGPGWGGRVALAASVALLVGGLVAVPAYVSTTATAALAEEIARSCVTDLGIVVDTHESTTAETIAARAATIDGVAAPEVSRRANARVVAAPGSPTVVRPVVVLWRPGVGALAGADDALLTDGAVLVPEWSTADGGYPVGSTLDLQFGAPRGVEPETASVTIGGTYPEIPTRPEPPEWCSYRDAFRLSALGDRPPPVLLVGEATTETAAPASWHESSQVFPDPVGLRIDRAESVAAELSAWQDEIWETFELPESRKPPVPLTTSIDRARQVADFVRLTTQPVRYAAAAAALFLVVAAAMLAARAQRSELRLRVVRGEGAGRLAVEQVGWLLPVTLAGAAVGWIGAWIGVRWLGPSSAIEPRALVDATVAAVAGWTVATLVAGAVVASVGLASVDRRPSRRRVRGLPLAGAVLLALAAWSYVRLDRFGGVRQIGVEVRGGDLLAQAFPLIGALAVLTVLAVPLMWLARRARRLGGSFGPTALIGLRRVTFEPAVSVAIAVSSAVAVAVAFQAGSLTDSVDRLLTEKATTYVGTDLVIGAIDPVDDLSGLGEAATLVFETTTDDRAVRVLGIDPATFADVAWFRSDGLDMPPADAVAALAADESAAIVVDPERSSDDAIRTITVDGVTHDLEPVAHGDFFPGYQRGRPMVVVDAAVLDGDGAREVWVRGPDDDAVARLTERGVRVRSVLSPDEVFASTNYLSAEWAYATLTAFAIVIGVVTLLGQLLVVESRRRRRRASRVLSAPMGFGGRDETLASAIEIGLPLAVGGVLGALVGWGTSQLAIARLDSLRDRQPPAVLVVDVTALVGAAVVVVVVTAGLAVWSSWRSGRGDPMEAMRVAGD
ncbi:MAG: hypothetical protein KDB37_14785 [Ilumatobacter sp.]|nr:hypothetical protein [Ilumatobacter sp.]